MSVPYDALNMVESGTLPLVQRKIRALVVDDMAPMQEAACGVLEMHGIDVVGRAGDGLQAVAAVAELNPELVLMDVRMPLMDGLQATRLLTEHFPDIRVVLMSGEQSPELGEQCRASGADAFVFKLDFPQEFAAILQRLFPESRLRMA